MRMESMKVKHNINSLVDKEKPSEKSTEKYECGPCKFDGENISGEFWCFECKIFLCHRCKKEHVRHKFLRNHKLVPASDAGKENTTMATAVVEEPCTEHKRNGCVLCLAINHRKNKNIKTFDEITEDLKQTGEKEQFFHNMKEIESKAEITSSRTRENVTTIQNQQTTILGKADDVMQKAKAKLDKCHEELKHKVFYHHKEETTKILDTEDIKQKRKIEQFSDKMKEIKSKEEMVATRKRGNVTSFQEQQTTILGKADDVIQEAKAKLDRCNEEFKDKVNYHREEETTKLLAVANKLHSIQTSIADYQKIWRVITEFGFKRIFTLQRIKEHIEYHKKELEVCVKENQLISLDTKISTRELDIITSETVAEVKVKLSFLEDLLPLDTDDLSNPGNAEDNVSMDSPHIDDLEPVRVWEVRDGDHCSGGTFLRDGRLLLVDWRSKTLNVYSGNGKREICHSVSYTPWDAAQHSDDSIYITSQSDNYIRVYTLMSLSDTLSLQQVKSIGTDISSKNFNAINITHDSYILVATIECIYVMTMEGKTKIAFETTGMLSSIATSTSDTESVFYYWYCEEVVCRSITGVELLRYKINIPGLVGFRGIALDKWGNIYFSHLLSKNIFLVSKDGEESRVLPSNIEGISDHFKVGFDRSGSKFFVTNVGNACTVVYKLNVKK